MQRLDRPAQSVPASPGSPKASAPPLLSHSWDSMFDDLRTVAKRPVCVCNASISSGRSWKLSQGVLRLDYWKFALSVPSLGDGRKLQNMPAFHGGGLWERSPSMNEGDFSPIRPISRPWKGAIDTARRTRYTALPCKGSTQSKSRGLSLDCAPPPFESVGNHEHRFVLRKRGSLAGRM